jgi:hypothetical protein
MVRHHSDLKGVTRTGEAVERWFTQVDELQVVLGQRARRTEAGLAASAAGAVVFRRWSASAGDWRDLPGVFHSVAHPRVRRGEPSGWSGPGIKRREAGRTNPMGVSG